MEEFVNGKNHTIVTANNMTDMGMKIPVTFTIGDKKYVSTFNGRIEAKDTREVKE